MEGKPSSSSSTPRWKPHPGMHAPGQLRSALTFVTAAWGFGAVWMYITTGAALTQYAKSMNMSKFGFGLLAALPFAGLLVQVYASYLIERYGNRKKLFIIAGTAHRAMWLLIAAIPWLPAGIAPPAQQWIYLLLFMAVSTFLANLNGPAWLVWMADLVPERIRGRYFARRGQLGRFVGVVTTLAIGFTLDRASGGDSLFFQRVISIGFIIAAICGMVDIIAFRWVPDYPPRAVNHGMSFGSMISRTFKNKTFVRFVAFNATMTFAIAYVGQFAWLFLLEEVFVGDDWANVKANMMLVLIPIIVTMATFGIWGRLVDRLGCRPVLLIAGVMVTHGALAWVFVTKDDWWLGMIAAMSATAAWPGIELASQNLILGVSGSDQNQAGGSAFVAVHSFFIGIAGVASGIFGGLVAQTLRDYRGEFLGYPLTYHGLLFAISAGIRIASLVWLIGMHEPESYTARAALRYMATNIYSNMQQAMFASVRGLGRLRKKTLRF
ncbi:MAG: MFS transporter [Phycisphaeraceae bacterium]